MTDEQILGTVILISMISVGFYFLGRTFGYKDLTFAVILFFTVGLLVGAITF